MWLSLLPIAAADPVLTARVGVGLPDLLGGSVSVTALRPVEVEVGGATGILYDTVFARAGAALPLVDRRADGITGPVLEGLVLGGWRYLRGRPWTGDDRRNGAELDLALDGTWWGAPHLGFEAQVLVGGGLWIGSEADGGVAPFLDGRFAVGVAF